MSATTSIKSVREALEEALELLTAIGKDLALQDDTPAAVLGGIAYVLAIGRAALMRDTQ